MPNAIHVAVVSRTAGDGCFGTVLLNVKLGGEKGAPVVALRVSVQLRRTHCVSRPLTGNCGVVSRGGRVGRAL